MKIHFFKVFNCVQQYKAKSANDSHFENIFIFFFAIFIPLFIYNIHNITTPSMVTMVRYNWSSFYRHNHNTLYLIELNFVPKN